MSRATENRVLQGVITAHQREVDTQADLSDLISMFKDKLSLYKGNP